MLNRYLPYASIHQTMRHIVSTLLTLIFLNCQSQDLVPFHVDTLWGFKDRQGTVRIQPQYQYATRYFNHIAIVAKNNKLGVVDTNNHQVVPFRYEFLRPLDTAEFLFGYRAKYFGEHIMGVMDKNERVKIPAEYSYITKYKNTYTVIKKIDSIIGKAGTSDVRSVRSIYGLYNSAGKVLIPCQYDYISWINDTLIDVTTGGLGTSHALFDYKGKQLTGFEYMVFGKFIDGIAKARIDNKFGFIYPTGKVAIPIQFDYCEDFDRGYAIIKQQNKWGAIDRKGNVIIEPSFAYDEVSATLKEKYGR